MRFAIPSMFIIYFSCVHAQTTVAPNYYCYEKEDVIQFTLSSLPHSAWQPTLNCSLQQCNESPTDNNNCRSSSTPCYDYHTHNNISYCAPGILCSILEPCNNITYTCASNNSACIVNSCCLLQAVCVSLSWINICTSSTDSTTTASITSTTSSTSRTSTIIHATTTTTAMPITITATIPTTTTTAIPTTTTTARSINTATAMPITTTTTIPTTTTTAMPTTTAVLTTTTATIPATTTTAILTTSNTT
ncbi:unnamed protein product [Rotaria magnacalcarata]|uniref:Uncharacterized protein n=2 Tax=Rotaria magnacalcarata TaxID=392030 RepID=A0A815YVS7_9BILA|nr:unnamed protein product [Rotaria magnacalcarata]